MSLKSLLKRLFGGEVIEKFNSLINGEILVVRELSGRTAVRVGGISQSGGMVEDIWEKALKEIRNLKLEIKNCLVLGLGCGTVAELLAEEWPRIKITGVEIDKKMIEVGRKYFNLDKTPNLKILIKDAISIVQGSRPLGFARLQEPGTVGQARRSGRAKFKIQNFDLILVDLYLDQEFPRKAESEEFLNNLKEILAKDGLIIFNRLNFGKHRKRTEEFLTNIKRFFPKVWFQKTEFNLFVFCR